MTAAPTVGSLRPAPPRSRPGNRVTLPPTAQGCRPRLPAVAIAATGGSKRRAPSSCPATAIMPTPGRPNGRGTRALIARRHVEVVADQFPLDHREGLPRLAGQARVDGD